MTEVYFFQQQTILIFVSQSKEGISNFKNAIKYTYYFRESQIFTVKIREKFAVTTSILIASV
jgi:hypothetical protein